jgi:hypothetical protein
MPKGQDYAVLLRVYALKGEIEPGRVKEALELSEVGSPVASVSYSDEKSMLTVSFDGELPLHEKEIELWQTPEFKSIAEWLRSKTAAQFEKVAHMGLGTDVFVGRYWGKVPDSVLKEIVRLGIGLWFSY